MKDSYSLKKKKKRTMKEMITNEVTTCGGMILIGSKPPNLFVSWIGLIPQWEVQRTTNGITSDSTMML